MYVCGKKSTLGRQAVAPSARRAAGARTVLVFDPQFKTTVERRVVRELLTRLFSTPRGGADGASTSGEAAALVEHVMSFSWLDGRVWMRVYRMCRNVAGTDDLEEIGPRIVLNPMRVIASGFGGAVLRDETSW